MKLSNKTVNFIKELKNYLSSVSQITEDNIVFNTEINDLGNNGDISITCYLRTEFSRIQNILFECRLNYHENRFELYKSIVSNDTNPGISIILCTTTDLLVKIKEYVESSYIQSILEEIWGINSYEEELYNLVRKEYNNGPTEQN